MPKRKIDPLGRNHQVPRYNPMRSKMDTVCDWVLDHAKDEFHKNPSLNHAYFDAYTLIHGFKAACEMLERLRG